MIFSGDSLIIFGGITYSGSDLVAFWCGSHSLDCHKISYMGIDPRHCQCVYLTLFITFMMWPIVGVPRITGTQAMKLDKSGDNEGYLILIIALGSIYLNSYNDIANWLSEDVSQACTDDSSPMRSERGPTSRE